MVKVWRVDRSVREAEEIVNVLEAVATGWSKGPPQCCVPACSVWGQSVGRGPADLASPA